MIETPEAAHRAAEIAKESDFLSIGTNDLTQLVLGLDREQSKSAPVTDVRVLRLIDAAVQAGRAAGIPVDVCGEAASDSIAMPILVGLGVDELSVGASRVGTVRAWVRELDRSELQELAARALWASSPDEVEAIVAPIARRLMSVEGGDAVAQSVERERGVLAAGGQA
jgi:phosphocarrier protein FPr